MAERQKAIFLNGEGDAWFERNKDKVVTIDPVADAISATGIVPRHALEVGCGTGWRLSLLKEMYSCDIAGIEPSAKAVSYAEKEYGMHVNHGSTNYMRFMETGKMDLIIFGFCLYLVDRDDLFSAVAQADRILSDGGHVVIHDFLPDAPHKKAYHHKNGVFSYKMDYAKLWLGNPAYTRIYNSIIPEGGYGVSIIKKDNAAAWPERA